MPTAIDLAYVIYQAPDLDRMEDFMHDFGLLTAEKRDDALLLRGGGTAPVVHVTFKGEKQIHRRRARDEHAKTSTSC
ncbi:MAG: hypothetical protein R3D59_15380 [Paracoccaceae bacterium]